MASSKPKSPNTLQTRLWLALLLALLGVGASIASIYATPIPSANKLSCGLEALDCTKALTSEYSKVAGIPLGVFGLFYFSFWAMNLRATMRTGEPIFNTALSMVTLLGALTSLVLGTIMFFVLNAPCLYCMITHSSNLLSVALLWPIIKLRPDFRMSRDHFWHFASLIAISALAATALYFANTTRIAEAQLKETKQQLEASQVDSLEW